MTNKNTEELMKESGFTSNEMKLLKSINKRNNTTLLDEMMNLENRFYRLLVVLPLSFSVLIFFFLMAEKINIIGLVIAILILLPLSLFITSFKLSYKSFIFMRKYKRL
ncbi:hypothetical protein Xmau_04533 [Xenorhabdus mauleonii]|uniref:Uncharacterized protein n=1 Tax=Xenorhabdus mauleonii TaxID=351675 RepID=A0A1I3YST8_9GAMM|nr:hypothetical protein [Xenorhabdus mauleonii]PHM33426.1 hypothetical protein Xmau_04533 [Xenorhabdus mauleonii]SFK34912.1 hypothetical protein SAMN05421680_1694 [Xenorhabdus mauleonii]